MKKFKQLFSIILIGLFAFISFIGVNAVSETISLGKAEILPKYMDHIISFSTKEMTNGELVYCLNMHAKTAKNIKANLIGKGDAGLTYILENGYPNKSFTGNSQKDYYITQVAVWMYLDDTAGGKNLDPAFRNNTGEMMDHIKKLVANAKQAEPEDNNLKLEISSDSTTLSLKDNYYVSDPIYASTLEGVESYTVSVSGSEQAEIIDANNNPISTISGNDSFRVRVPASVVSDTTSLVVTAKASKTTYQSYKYRPTDTSMQNVARAVKDTKNVNSVLTFTGSRASVTINKIDAETGASLAGAIIGIYDINGAEVRKFTTSFEPYVITDLEDGTYTVQEVSAPNGYMRNESTFKFTIDGENKSHVVTIENYKEVIVPNTDTTSTILLSLLGIVITGIGVVYVRRNGKKA
ncbi:MAG: Cys-Gln thioester bond-forming surface protein [Bacilli bacterium]|nr:Cys-Gln thioester bond-forming surface protein [Bacilli bacterium]